MFTVVLVIGVCHYDAIHVFHNNCESCSGRLINWLKCFLNQADYQCCPEVSKTIIHFEDLDSHKTWTVYEMLAEMSGFFQ